MTYSSDPDRLHLPWFESPFFESQLAASSLPDEDRELVRRFADQGYLVIDPRLADFDRLAERVVRDLESRYEGADRRLMDAWAHSEAVLQIARCERIHQVLRLLYRREPIPFQTLNFEVGTQQWTHSDTIHFHSFPRRFMCGVWVALEDIDPDNGPLHYYPGSHRLDEFTMADLGLPASYDHYQEYEGFVAELMQARGFERAEATIPKGQAFIWSANLFHGGCPIRDPSRTRHSQVTHFFFEGGMYYQPMGSSPFEGRICRREVLNLRTGQFVPHVVGDRVIDLEECDLVWRYPRPLPEGFGVEAPPARR